jgi:hypothetical protein
LNFVAHVCVASYFSQDAAVGFGALLPDFVSLLGLKSPTTRHPGIAYGVNLHHLTDAAFHELHSFRETCNVEAAELRRLGIPRGPAQAVAHVGIEFLLDDALAEDAPTQSFFTSSLRAGSPEALGSILDWTSSEQAERFDRLRQQVCSIEQPNGPLASSLIAERIARTLRNRPKLAVPPTQQTIVLNWVQSIRGRMNGLFPELIEQVLRTLRTKVPTPRTQLRDSLQFRRA